MLKEWCEKTDGGYSGLASKIGMSRNYVWTLANDGTRRPSLPVAFAIQDATGIPARYWVDRQPSRAKGERAA